MLGLGAMEANQVLYIVILLFSAFLTAAYLFPVVIAGFFRRGDDEKEGDRKELDPPRLMMVPIIMLSVIIILLGLFPNLAINFIDVIIVDVF